MAEPVEDKGVLARKLEEDRKKMAVQAGELKDDYNPVRKVAVSIRKDPLAWTISIALVGVLLARLLGRPKEILLSAESVDRTRAQELPRLPTDPDESSETKKLLSLAKWALGAYLIREFDRCLVQPFSYLAERILAREQTRRYLRDLQDWVEKQSQSLPYSLQRGINKGSLLADLLQKQLKKLKRRSPFKFRGF